MAGRAELFHTVINLIVLHWLLVYNMPTSTIIKLDRLCANFFWAGKHHKISWSKPRRAKKENGIGLKSFNELKTTACLKLIWQLHFKDNMWSIDEQVLQWQVKYNNNM